MRGIPEMPKRNDESHKTAEDVVVVGRIQSAYGIKGWVHLSAFTDPKDNILSYRPWLLGSTERKNPAERKDQTEHVQTERMKWRTLEIAEVRAHKQGFVARLVGVNDRNDAESLKGALIGVPASELPPADLDEFYWRDLIGRTVVDVDGTTIGRVSGLMETGAHDVLVVKSGREGDVLIPFHRQYVVNVDLAADRIEVDWRQN
jgi:16S rRNA processing protein RimM